MNDNVNIQHNKLMKLDDMMLNVCIYNAETFREINQTCTQNS